jgi:hypothetical protein
MAVNGTDTQLAAAFSASNTSSATPSEYWYARAYHPAARNSTAMHHHTARSSRRMADQLNQQELSRLQAGDSPRPAPCVREPNAGSTPVQRAMIALESVDKSRPPMPTERIKSMKHLLTGVAVVAALAFTAPVWAQPANPSGGNAMGMPGPNPGGPGLTPYSTGQPRPVAAPPMAPPPPAAAPPPSMSDSTSATPPMHRHARKASHGKMAGHTGKGPKLTGSTANQLNQEELARLQAGNFSNPSAPPPPGPGMMPPPSGPRTSGSSGAGPR